MRQNKFVLAASCIVAATGLLLALVSRAEKPSSERIIYSFTGGSDGANPESGLIFDSAGNLYGTTYHGGAVATRCNQGCGTVFELKRSADGWKEEVLYRFSGRTDGDAPAAGLIFDNTGNLYGTTLYGGADYGTVFKLTPNQRGAWTESTIYTFDINGSSGNYPAADLVFDSVGNLYGTTSGGAEKGCNYNGCGAVFELTPHPDGSWTETTIHSFSGGADGGQPSSAVVVDSMGNVYGMTVSGGTGKCVFTDGYPGCGIVYEFTPNSGGGWTETVLYNFIRGGGYAVNPFGGLILNSSSDLFATSLAGGDGSGTVFELKQLRKGWEQNIPHRFYGNPDGIWPVGKVEMDEDGAVFGTTSSGGLRDKGVVFELKRSETGVWKERVLHSFKGSSVADGQDPAAGVVSDSRGHLYGTTYGGGSGKCTFGGCGTVYEITP